MEPVAKRGIARDISRVQASKRFGRYKDESSKTEREPDIQAPDLSKILDIWEYSSRLGDVGVKRAYAALSPKIERIRYTSEDVARTCVLLGDAQVDFSFKTRVGAFLSALINSCPDQDYDIDVGQIPGIIEYLGFLNMKNVTVAGDLGSAAGACMRGGRLRIHGNVGGEAGRFMEGGTLTVHGNVGVNAGEDMSGGRIHILGSANKTLGKSMSGGSILVEGDCKGHVGSEMRDGKIVIKGDVKVFIGIGMRGGEIHIDGEIGRMYDSIEGGRIFHKGKLIVDK
jgi:hypothetical protein